MIGTAETTLNGLTKIAQIQIKQKNKITGTLIIEKALVSVHDPNKRGTEANTQQLDYMQGGCDSNVTVTIDYTASVELTT